MRRINLLFLGAIFFFACDEKIDVIQPTIISKTGLNGVGDSLVFETVEYITVENERIEPDYYNWEIKKNDVLYEPDSTFDNIMIWFPKEVGHYIIYVTIGYDNNKSITVLKEIDIIMSPAILQSRLIGTWCGYYVNQYGFKSKNITLIIDDDGHYIGNNEGGVVSAMLWGSDIDVPCAVIIVESIENSKGSGKIFVPFGNYDNDPDAYCCEFFLKDLEFISGHDSVTFKVQDFGCNFDNEFISHYLKKY